MRGSRNANIALKTTAAIVLGTYEGEQHYIGRLKYAEDRGLWYGIYDANGEDKLINSYANQSLAADAIYNYWMENG